MFQPRFLLLVLMICVSAALRLVDHPWNLAPMGALALFAGAHFREKRWAFLVPIAAMMLSDLAIGIIQQDLRFYTFHNLVPFVYGCYALSVCLGFWVRGCWNAQESGSRIAGEPQSNGKTWSLRGFYEKALPVAYATLAGSILFFLVTNFGVWLLKPSQTWASLAYCYWEAILFFRTTLGGDVFYVPVLFGGYALLKDHLPVLNDGGLLRTD
jgi:hypothetical protein